MSKEGIYYQKAHVHEVEQENQFFKIGFGYGGSFRATG